MHHGFTLVELMVVIVIMGILVTIGTFAFQSSQKKSRDVRRKSDLYELTRALEMYNSDNGVYPSGGASGSSDAGKIIGCGGDTKVVCDWGAEFYNADTNTIYMTKLPKDPSTSSRYYYEKIGKGYRLYARLENTEDADIPTTGSFEYNVNCGSSTATVYCNYSIASSNLAVPTPKP